MKMKMVDKTEQSDRAANPNGSRKVATARHCRRGPCVYRAIRDGWPCPVIREKSQSRAQNDSLSLSSAHDSTSLYLHFRALGRPFLWAAYFFAPSFTLERMSADHLPQSSSASRFTAACFGFLLLRATALPFFGGIICPQSPFRMGLAASQSIDSPW